MPALVGTIRRWRVARRKLTLKGIVNSLVRPGSDAVQRVTDPDPTWTSWAAERGLEYQHDGSEFEGGRYHEAVPDRRGVGEQCYGVVRGTWNDTPFAYFLRKTWRVGGRGGPAQTSGNLLITLPGTPIPDLLRMSPAEAFKAAGGELPNTGVFEWRPPDLLFGHGRWLEPQIVTGILQRITAQLALAPAELWQR
ncbi:MAG: hypothetical protein H0W25_00935 [Acidimicrobiia bacterium]|nr:hypothetical protein [Acidimicrobiia bacterium]